MADPVKPASVSEAQWAALTPDERMRMAGQPPGQTGAEAKRDQAARESDSVRAAEEKEGEARAAGSGTEPSGVEKAVAAAFAGSKDGKGFHEALEKSGLTLARANDGDVAAIASETAANPARHFPPVTRGDLVAVDRLGDVHRLDPARPDAAAIEARFNEPFLAETTRPVPSVAEAHAGFAAEYEPTMEKRHRDRLRGQLDHVRAALAAGSEGRDPKETSRAVALLADLVEAGLPQDVPADDLRGALAALADGDTQKAADLLEDARERYLDGMTPEAKASPKPDLVVEKIDAAMDALTHGDRAACMDLTREAIALLEPKPKS